MRLVTLVALALTIFSSDARSDGRIKNVDISSTAAIAFSKMGNLSANTILGNNTGSPGPALNLTIAQVNSLLGVAATAFALSYTPTVPGNWSSVPTTVGGALDFLAASDAGITQLTGDVASGPGNGSQAATISLLAVTNAKIANSTIDLTTKVTGVLPNANTTATAAAGNSTIVQRDGSGNFSAGTITAALTGVASGNELPLTFSAPLSRAADTISCIAATGLVAGCLSAADWTTFNGKQAAGSYITALTGDVTASGPGSVAATIANSAVTNAKLANMATQTFKGRTTAGAGAPEDLTATQATGMLNAFTSGLNGLAPSSGGGSVNFLRADGTWSVPPVSTPPLTTKGDIYTFSTADARLPVGADGQVLTADSALALGVKWAAAASSGSLVKATKTAAYTVAADDVLFLNGTFTLTLEAANARSKVLRLINIGTGTVTVACVGADKIGNTLSPTDTTMVINPGESIPLVSDDVSIYRIAD